MLGTAGKIGLRGILIEQEWIALPVSEDATHEARQTVQAQTASPQERRLRRLVFQGCLFSVLIAFAGLAFLAHTSAYFPIDLTITRAFQAFDPAWFAGLMRLVSWPGHSPQGGLIVLLAAVLLFRGGLRWEAVVGLAAGFGAHALNLALKLAIQRPRPASDLVEVFRTLTSFSFPSGHVMFYSVFFGFLCFLAYTLLRSSWLRMSLVAFFAGLVVLVGPSRVYLGEHWSSDVLGAYLVSSLLLVVMIQFYSWGKKRFFHDQPVASE